MKLEAYKTSPLHSFLMVGFVRAPLLSLNEYLVKANGKFSVSFQSVASCFFRIDECVLINNSAASKDLK